MTQHGTNLGLSWRLLGGYLNQLGPTWGQLKPTLANMTQRKPIWRQLETNMDLKIIEKPPFFLGSFDIIRKSLETFGNALESVRESFRDALERLWGRLEKP